MALLSRRRGISDLPKIRVREDRLRKDLLELARYGEEQDGGVMRTALSDADMEARRWFKDRMSEAGLRVQEDAAANIIGRLDPTADLIINSDRKGAIGEEKFPFDSPFPKEYFLAIRFHLSLINPAS